MLRSLARTRIHSTALRTKTRAAAVNVAAQRRHVSHYNTDVAGLTEDQAEVRSYRPSCSGVTGRPDTDSVCMQFRNAVQEFAEKEVAPRAAKIDRSNTFPMVSASCRVPSCTPNGKRAPSRTRPGFAVVACFAETDHSVPLPRTYGRSSETWASWA